MSGALRRGFFRGLLRVGAVVAFAAGIALPGAVPAAAATGSATIDQCTNGGLSPLTPEPCVGGTAAAVPVTIAGINGGNSASYKNWVNGNSNKQKSHWLEGEFIPYRVVISDVAASSHTIQLHYDTVFSGGSQAGHAIDYLGSYDATETTSTTPTSIGSVIFHANNSSPCQDLVIAGEMAQVDCVPETPVSSFAVPAADTSNCGGSQGTFGGTQAAGDIKAYGPSGTLLTGFTYDSQNVGTATCETTFTISFDSPSVDANHAIVLAWGGHIASAADWGTGNAASDISGSPYHMALDALDGASTGSQDRSMDTDAVVPTPIISTTVKDATGTTVTTSAPAALGAVVHDTATLSGGSSPITGTVTYSFFTNSTCAGTADFTQNVTIGTSNTVPGSSAQTLGAGGYSYSAHYAGDIPSNAPADSTCEPFAVSKASSSTSTTVFDNATKAAWAGTEVAGATAYDTATVTGVAGFAPIGTVTYNLFSNGTCAGSAGTTQTVTMAAGAAPKSDATGALAAGAYSYQATYSGDGNYTASTSSCEPFTVATAPVPVPGTAAQIAPTTVSPALAFTGTNGWSLLLTAAVFLGVGGLLILGTRRQRRDKGA